MKIVKDSYTKRYLLAGPDPSEKEIASLEKICAMCQATENLELDHIVPLVRKGRNSIDNRQWLCRRCNRRKGFKSISAGCYRRVTAA